MFDRFDDNEMVFIWVGVIEEESILLKSVRSLRDLQVSQNPISLKTIPVREKLRIKRRDLQEFEIMFPLNEYNKVNMTLLC